MKTVSKFKNAIPRWPKKEELITEIPIKQLDITFGDSISANNQFVYFSLGVSEIGALPIRDHGKKQFIVPKFNAGSDPLTSLTSTPLDVSLVATISNFECPKVWKFDLADSFSLIASLDAASITKAKSVSFHPSTSEILSYTSQKGVGVSNILDSKQTLNIPFEKGIMSHSWKSDGSLMAVCEEGGSIYVIDPRTNALAQKANADTKNPKIIWAGMKDDIVMEFASEANMSNRVALAWDVRNMSVIWSKEDLEPSRAIMYPIFDPDTGMIVVASKGENSFCFMELEENGFSTVRVDRSDEASFGLCCVPRQCLNLMSCEVMYLLQINKSSISPVPYYVTRKSYSSFHSDLYPPTYSLSSPFKAESWFSGQNYELVKEALEPVTPVIEKTAEIKITEDINDASNTLNDSSNMSDSKTSFNIPAFISNPENYSKYRNIDSIKLHPRLSHECLLNIETKTGAESNGVFCFFDNIALPLIGVSGKIGILKMSKPGRVLETGPFYVENRSPVCDFEIDRKNDNLLAALCEDCSINIWKLPPGGMEDNLLTPDARLIGHTDRATILRFHPSASDVFATGSIDGSIRIWDIIKQTTRITCNVLEKNQILSVAWNQLGSQFATASVDKKLNIFDPRSQCNPSMTAPACPGVGSSRVFWVDDNMLFLSGFNAEGNRYICLKDTRNANENMFPQILDLSPSVLIPSFDPDTKLVYLSGKGDTSILPYEIRNDGVGLFECPRYTSNVPHAAFSFLRKDLCDVSNVEVARCVRIIKSSTEIVSFSVPRARANYFQDDIFSATRKVWNASMTSEQWYGNSNTEQDLLDLQPANMVKLSEAKVEVNTAKKYDSSLELTKANQSTLANRKDYLGDLARVMETVEDKRIIQDEKEGVDEAEWEN